MRSVEDVGYSCHANSFDGHSQDVVGALFKVRLAQPVMIVARGRMLAEGVFSEEEIGAQFIDGLGQRVG